MQTAGFGCEQAPAAVPAPRRIEEGAAGPSAELGGGSPAQDSAAGAAAAARLPPFVLFRLPAPG